MHLFSPVKLVLPFLVLLFLTSCEGYHHIEFIDLKDIAIVGIEGNEIIVNGVAEFNNPNGTGVSLVRAEVFVYMDGKKVARLEPDGKVKIDPMGKFYLPVKAGIDITDGDTLSGLLSLFSKKSRNLEFKGYIVIRKFLLPIKVKVNHNQRVFF